MNNIARIKTAIAAHKFDAMLIVSPINRLFATGFQSSAGVLLVTANDAWFFTDSRYIEAAENTIADATVLESTRETTHFDHVKTILNEQNIAAVGFEDASLTYSEYLEWRRKLKVSMVRAERLLVDLRRVKSPEDLANMKKAQQIAEKSFLEILPLISTEITEKDLATELLYRFLQNGADDKAFSTIVVSGAKSSMPHGVPENIKIGKGFLTIDFGARLDGWCSDTTRTLCIGQPDDEMKHVYETVLRAQEAGISIAKAGVNAAAVDAAGREVIENAGYGENFSHGFGHAIGLEVHESPSASPTSKGKLIEGVVISAEPGIYLPGRFGVRIEDLLYITKDGNENLTNLPKELIVI